MKTEQYYKELTNQAVTYWNKLSLRKKISICQKAGSSIFSVRSGMTEDVFNYICDLLEEIKTNPNNGLPEILAMIISVILLEGSLLFFIVLNL